MAQIRQAAFEIVSRLRRAKGMADVLGELRAAGDVYGYTSFIVSNLPVGTEGDTQNCALLPSWPEEWRKRYFERGYVHVDPIANHVRHTTMPFLWSEAPYDADDAPAARVMNEAHAFDLVEGFCVPVHHLKGQEGGISFGAKRLDLSNDAKAGLHLVSMYAYGKVDELVRIARSKPAPGKPRLSKREIECLKWAAAGKTAWEASAILSVSERTVEFHLNHAARKLNAVNRVQSVAEAIRHGIIT